MITHSSLYRELYRFTNEYKEKDSNRIIKKFIFKPSVPNTDGYNFINSDILYSGNLDIIPETRVYFNNISGKKSRFLNKHIRLCNIPISEITNSNSLITKLNKYVYKNPNLESITRRNSLNGEDPAKLFNGTSISKYIYGLQFNSDEFYEATGIYITITRRKLNDLNKKVYTSRINNNYDTGNGLNIQISAQSSTYLEIEFDETYEDLDVIYEIRLYETKVNKSNSESFDYEDNNTNIIDLQKLTIDKIDGLQINDSYKYKLNHKDILYKSLLLVNLNITFKNGYSTKLSLYDHEYEIKYTSDGTIIEFIDDLSNYLESLDIFDTYIEVYEVPSTKDYSVKELKNCLSEYNIDVDYYESSYIDPSMGIETVSEVIKNDEKELLNSLPFSLQYILENKSTFHIEKVNKLLFSNIGYIQRENYNHGSLCIKYTLNNKHDSIMFFKHNRLLTPTLVESDNKTYTIYIDLLELVPLDVYNEIRRNVNGIGESKKFIDLDTLFYIVYDTDKYFIENMRYDVKSIYKYINISKTQRYSINTDDNGNEIYVEDPNGEYIVYKNDYMELGDKNYYIDEKGNYNPLIPNDYTGDIYNKMKTNEYLLPVNKDIDPTKLVITIENYHPHNDNDHYRKDPDGVYISLAEVRYYRTYNTSSKTGLYIKIDGDYILYDDTYSNYDGEFYIKKEPGFIIPPYYFSEDVHYTKIGNKCVILANIFNLEYSENIVAQDTYTREDNVIIENDIINYDKESFINKMVLKKFNINYPSQDTYYSYLIVTEITKEDAMSLIESGETVYIDSAENSVEYLIKYNDTYSEYEGKYYKVEESEKSLYSSTMYDTYKKFDSNGNIIISNIPALYYKTNDGKFENNDSVNTYIRELSEFIDMNRVYKFSLKNGEILDGGYADTDEYLELVDAGSATSFSDYQSTDKETAKSLIESGENVYILINDNYVLYNSDIHSDYDGNFYYDFVAGEIDKNMNYDDEGNLNMDDDYPIYDFNFSSPYTIVDDTIKAYRIDSSYSNYFINSDDEYLAYVIPNQLINSENKLMTFLDGKYTDEYMIQKNLYSRLFGGDTILSFTDDPEDSTGKDYTYTVNDEGEYYYDPETNSYVYDPERDKSIMVREDNTTYYKVKNYDEYVISEAYDIGEIENIEIESNQKYFKLINEYNGSNYITTEEYYNYMISYAKSISTVFMCNMRNLSLYQHTPGISYKDKIFTINNTVDSVVYNERLLYKNIYFPPLSDKYMLFLINGRFANPYIKIITPQRFVITDTSFLEGNTEINQIKIYTYDNYLYNLNYYDVYFEKVESINSDESSEAEYNLYFYNDTMWESYGDQIAEFIANDDSIKEISYKPKNYSYNATSDLVALYEIFGKYILSNYDIDNDPMLYDEIREYFEKLYDDDNRMRLELLQNKTKRKYIY